MFHRRGKDHRRGSMVPCRVSFAFIVYESTETRVVPEAIAPVLPNY